MSDEQSRPLLLGHRGARGVKSIRENTIASFDRALADGCDGFEFDVRFSADGEAVVWHDPELHGRRIAETPADRLTGLARLGSTLERYQDTAFLDIELKVSGVEKIVAKLLRRFPPRRGFVVSSFLPDVITSLYAEDYCIPLGLISERKTELNRWQELPITYVIVHRKLASRALCEQANAAQKRVLVWTVNDASEMRKFQVLGVDGIISDKTKLLCQTLGK